MFKLFKVVGTSMFPTLCSGDIVLATSFLRNSIKKNRLIIFFDYNHSFIIKRVKKINNNSIILQNDNKYTDSIFCNKSLDIKKSIFTVICRLRPTDFYKSLFFYKFKLFL